MTPPPTNNICEDFFAKDGGNKRFADGAIINRNGEQHECFTEKGPGDFGWCEVW